MIGRFTFFLFCCVWVNLSHAKAELTIDESVQLVNVQNDNGVLTNINGDGYIIFSGLHYTRAELCNIGLEMQFAEPLFRAVIFDLYWRTQSSAYNERDKAFFIINQSDTEEIKRFILPLCKLHNFSGNLNEAQRQSNITGLRIDFPDNVKLKLKLHRLYLNISPEKIKEENNVWLELYETNLGRDFTSLDVILPKTFMAINQGYNRLFLDTAFLIFWLSLILILLFLLIKRYFCSSK